VRRSHFRAMVVVASLFASAAARPARADICVSVDETRDMLSATERVAAIRLVTQEFERAGERLAPAPCDNEYLLSHIELGATIVVTLSGPRGRREATAYGLDDLPPVYNQMVRSLVTGQPMTLRGVVDRSNVSMSQSAKSRVVSDSVFYGRLGYGAVFVNGAHGVPSIGLIGYRHELDAFAIDVSFLNFGFSDRAAGPYGAVNNASSGSWMKLEALRFTRPTANNSFYGGGGLSWGGASVDTGSQHFDGNGIQGEFTAGYEAGRASTIRLFVQADATLPFYELSSTMYSYDAYYRGLPPVTSRRYAPALSVSLGLGWQHGAHTSR